MGFLKVRVIGATGKSESIALFIL